MILNRLTQLKNDLSSQHYDALCVTSSYNIRYLTGFCGLSPQETESILIVFPHRATLFVPEMYGELAQTCLSSVDPSELTVIVDEQKQGLFASAALALREGQAVTVGIEESYLRVSEMHRLQTLFHTKYVDGGSIVERMRMIKSDDEAKLLQRAQSITQKTFNKFQDELLQSDYTSWTEIDCVEKIRSIGLSLGADELAFETIVANGASASQPHYKPTHLRLQDNAVLLIDMGMRVEGYNGDFTRTILLGEPSDEIKKAHEMVTKANQICKTLCKPGVASSEIYLAQQKVYEKYGVNPALIHSIGHGVGLEIHEAPLLRPLKDQILQKGVVVTIEPGYYVPGKFGIRVEDMVIV